MVLKDTDSNSQSCKSRACRFLLLFNNETNARFLASLCEGISSNHKSQKFFLKYKVKKLEQRLEPHGCRSKLLREGGVLII